MVYLDNAATTFPKPPEVGRAMLHALNMCGGNAGRGGYRTSRLAAEKVFECREKLARLFKVGNPERIVFAKNATEALNTAIKGVVSPGDEIIISSMEHNSVFRPAIEAERRGAVLKIAAADPVSGLVSPGEIEKLITPKTKLVCVTHASNICGTVNDIGAIAALCRGRGCLSLFDCAQSAGALDIDASALDMLAFAGHKGLLGPQGTGGLYVREGIRIAPLTEGGTGSWSESAIMPDIFPDRLESGTLNAVGIAGLCEGVKFVMREGVSQKEQALAVFMREIFSDIRGAEVKGAGKSVAVVGLLLKNIDCIDAAWRLDSEFDIAARAGLHCAPLAHRTLGTVSSGMLRFSAGFFNTERDIRFAATALNKIAKKI